MRARWSKPAPAGMRASPRGASRNSSIENWREPAQLGLMAQIAALSDDTLGGLAERSGLEQSTLSRNLRRLEREGLIEIAMVESDLRRRAVWLTESGARRLETAIPLWRKAHAKLAERLRHGLARELAQATEALAQG